jgi:hypothetical protein
MKSKRIKKVLGVTYLLWMVCFLSLPAFAQDGPLATPTAEPVKYTFESTHIGDNQTINTLFKGSMEFVIQHRFGVMSNGYKDFYGLYAPSNIRLGFTYGITKDATLGFGFCKDRMTWDGNLKYALLRQSTSGMPVSVSYYGNFAVDTRSAEDVTFVSNADRISYFNQLLIARKINNHLSLQVAPSYTHMNNVEGYMDGDKVMPVMKNDHFAVAFMGRYKLSNVFSVIANYDQPLTVHPKNNPYPNVSGGIEMGTGSHTFQIFVGNYSSIVQQNNNFYNQNDYTNGKFLIGFNITRRWDSD